MSDKYFEQKAIEIYDKIHSAKIDNRKVTIEEIEHIIYLGLKEVARDQREACIDDVSNVSYNDPLNVDIYKVMHNADIKEK